jgi:hypothetical protein
VPDKPPIEISEQPSDLHIIYYQMY